MLSLDIRNEQEIRRYARYNFLIFIFASLYLSIFVVSHGLDDNLQTYVQCTSKHDTRRLIDCYNDIIFRFRSVCMRNSILSTSWARASLISKDKKRTEQEEERKKERFDEMNESKYLISFRWTHWFSRAASYNNITKMHSILLSWENRNFLSLTHSASIWKHFFLPIHFSLFFLCFFTFLFPC